MTRLTSSASGPSTSMTRRGFCSSPSNSAGRTSLSKLNDGVEWRARVTASENFAGCAVERTIWTVEGELDEGGRGNGGQNENIE